MNPAERVQEIRRYKHFCEMHGISALVPDVKWKEFCKRMHTLGDLRPAWRAQDVISQDASDWSRSWVYLTAPEHHMIQWIELDPKIGETNIGPQIRSELMELTIAKIELAGYIRIVVHNRPQKI